MPKDADLKQEMKNTREESIWASQFRGRSFYVPFFGTLW